MNDFIMLTCNSCGGKLQITPEIDEFACMYCGTEFAVNRGGGVISLTPLTDEIKKVQIGVDKTASELAIVRLNKELSNLYSDREKIDEDMNKLKIAREKDRQDLDLISSRRRPGLLILIPILSFLIALIFSSLILGLGPILCAIEGIVLSVIIYLLVYRINIRDILGKEKLMEFDNQTSEIENEFNNKKHPMELAISQKEREIRRHKEIVSSVN